MSVNTTPAGNEAAPTSTPETREVADWGLPLLGFAGLALCALVLTKGFAQALPGSATGIERWIAITSFLGACASQVLAAGGIALCLRLLGNMLGLPGLGLAFRITMAPVGLLVVTLVAVAAARPLTPELGRLLALTAVFAQLSALPFLLPPRWLRGAGLVLLASALSAILELIAYESSGGKAGGAQIMLVSALDLAARSLDAAAASLALIWVSHSARKAGALHGLLVAVVIALLSLARMGAVHSAHPVLVVLRRSIASLVERPSLLQASWLGSALSLFALLGAFALLSRRGQRPELRAALCLGLVARACAGAPVAALLSVGTALLLSSIALDPKRAPRAT
ncbi:MAG TPA: hypothetical protein VFQ61_25220 [Polyangiaceae bacterium]|nr:hypothetical protein [Polyangiaceae bacterium]